MRHGTVSDLVLSVPNKPMRRQPRLLTVLLKGFDWLRCLVRLALLAHSILLDWKLGRDGEVP